MKTKLCRSTPNNLAQVAKFIKEQTKDDPLVKDFKVENILQLLEYCQFVYFIKDLDTQDILSVLYAMEGVARILMVATKGTEELVKKFKRDALKNGLTKWQITCNIGEELQKGLWISQGAIISLTVLELNLESKPHDSK